ncbi:MAG: DUF3352 domain-containing protein [Actinobacteria bacterium]|nr:DUF3352 domain-containing protein [Actinomycetota bacterium]
MNVQKLLPASVLALIVVLAVAGCGGGGGGGGEPAGVVPKTAPVYLQANLAPDGETTEALNEVAQTTLGIDNVGEFVAEELENAAIGDEEKLNFEEEVEPWLGEKAGLYLAGYDGANFNGVGMALETTDSGEAEEFIEKRVKSGGSEAEEGEFEGNKYFEDASEESVIGMIGDYLGFSETKGGFEEMVEAFEGEGLNESEKFKEAMDSAPDEGIGSVYVDIGGLIEETKSVLPEETEAFFDVVGIEPKKATAVATVIPHSGQLEIDMSSNLGSSTPETGDATGALEALPATATLGFASADFGKSFSEGLEELSQKGIPGQVEPGELGEAFQAMGLDVESLGKSFGDLSGFVEGSSEADLGGAIVIATKDASEAKNMVANIGLLLRATKTPGVTAISGEVSGFSVRVPGLGASPLVVGSAGEKIVIAYGPKAAAQALRSQSKTLGQTLGFEAAKGSMGSTPMSAFVAGAPMLSLVESMLSPEELAEVEEARPFLEKIDYLAAGSEAEGDTQTAKLIIGLAK